MRLIVLALCGVLAVSPAEAQETLSAAAERAKQAISAHDAQALVGQSSNVVLQIPGADPSSALGRPQAIERLGKIKEIIVQRDGERVAGFIVVHGETIVGTGGIGASWADLLRAPT